MENQIFLLILLFLVQYYSVSISAASSNETDQQALLAFKNLVTSPSHLLATNWTTNTSFCSWFGVACSPKRQRIVALALPDMQLQGTISPSLANLSFLSLLNLGNNSFHGGIPYGLGHLPRLRVIDIQNNQLEGSIPTSLFQNQKVQKISLAYNSLSGPLLLDEGNIVSNLEFLGISHNKISGHIPSSICQLTELKVLSISFNKITGDLPKNISCLSNLEGFYVGENPITGTIPSSLANISRLQNLFCGNNRLMGKIPPEIGKLSNLRELNFAQNYNLIGEIPEDIFNISSLETINFSSNNLSHRILTSTGLHLPNLKHLHLSDNQLEGEIPLFITNASKLETLDLAGNFLTGTIPNNLGNLRELRSLLLHHNHLTNEPREHELRFFNSLVDCRMLHYLLLGSNLLNGVLPNSFGNLSSTIEILYIGDAHLNGLIPPGIGNMSGMIPSRFGQLSNLQILDLSNNSFSGVLFLRDDPVHTYSVGVGEGGTTPGLTYAPSPQLRWRGVSNPRPWHTTVSKLTAEPRPSLSGTIPKSLEKLSYLKAINVSFNNLEGEIPGGGVFANSTLQSFLGNNGLCGMHILEILVCPITNPAQQSKSKELVLKIVIPTVTSAFLIFLLVSTWIMKRKKKGTSKDVEYVPEIKTYQLISYHEIQRATSNFDGSNLIGAGSSGSVYKATLSIGTVVAIKVLDLENEQVCKRFDTECKVMRNVRHRNLVPVITTCSSDYIRAFVLEYMSNGSLENWLYREDCHLNLLQRVTVMLDAAMAIEYLHHCNETPIVHCDLKPSNILLDEDMVAHVGDFGISKILAVSKSMAHTKTLGTLGYIAPEYGSDGIVSTSGDVYSYGIMLMEVLTKRRPTDEEICNENLDLRKWITQSFSGSMLEVVDANLFPEEEQITSKSEICIVSMVELALDCTMEIPESRITIKDVVKRLNKIKNTFLEM
ncbi:hypothetical protein P3S68_030659 [Capsicum galapagoense]